MSEDDSMRLAAEIVNKWSGPLRDMRKDLRSLTDSLKASHETGAAQAKKHNEAFGDLGKTVARVDEGIKSSLTPALAAFGITTLTVAGAIATLKSNVLGFGDNTRQLSFLSRETGLSVQRLREFDALGRRVNLAPDAMRQGVAQFAQHMHNIRRLVPAEIDALRDNLRNPALISSVMDLANLPIDKALSLAIGRLDTIPEQQDKRFYLRMLGLPENLADVPVAELRRQMGEIHKQIGTLGPDAQQSALRFEDAIDRVGDAVDRLKLDVGTDLVDSFTHTVEAIREFVDENRGGLIVVLRDASRAMEGMLKDAHELLDFYQQLRSGHFLGPGMKKFLGEKDVDAIEGGADKLREGWQKFDDWMRSRSGQGEKFKNWLWGDQNVTPPFASPMDYRGDGFRSGGGFIKTSFTPGDGLLPAAFAPASGGAEEILTRSVKEGMIAALREWRIEAEGAAPGAPGGFTLASYHPNGVLSGVAGAGAVRSMLAPGAPGMTRGDRNNNPGNIEWGSFAAAHGAIGSDGRFAIFPNADMGTDAMAALLRQHYAGLTLGQIQQRWVGSPVAGYLGLMARATGLGPNDVPNMDDPAVLSALMGAMARGEGTHLPAGAANRSPMPAVRRLLERFNSDGDTATGNIWSRGAAPPFLP
ncbi:MAG TPA: hypothetical protein VMR17_01105, partial [Xanthobacteraceae bacterium]|nr:hypothetical protein [Xanthobacteraceae bacterium]